ncbi:MAG: T9SS type A sorting domain-containing protein [Bacteroidia bacterium]|nr:T9SS type A sorting domain-containing protein [Bacteroidia bacterium]
MKKLFSLCFGLLLLNANAQIGNWTQKADLPFIRKTNTAFSLEGKGYTCGGVDVSTDYRDLWQYDPISNTWSQKADMPGLGRRELSSFVIDSFAYVGHGRNVSNDIIYNSFYKYNPRTNTWSSIANCPVQRYTSTGFSIDSIGYVTCGILPGVARYKDLYAYNPRTNSWSQKASLPSNALNRSYACVVTVNHMAYLMGGFEGNHMKDFYQYNPSSNSWTQKADFAGGKRNAATGFAIGDYVIMGIGRDSSTSTYHDFYYYDINNNSWTQMKDYPDNNSAGGAAFVINRTAYVVGGNLINGNASKSVYSFTAWELTSVKDINQNIAYVLYKPYNQNALIFNGMNSADYTYKIYNIKGQLMQSGSFHQSLENTTISTNDLNTGIYLVEVQSSGKSWTLKFFNE